MSDRAIARLFHTTFTGGHPLQVEAMATLVNALCERLTPTGVQLQTHGHGPEQERFLLGFAIAVPGNPRYACHHDLQFSLHRGPNDQLVIRSLRAEAEVSSFGELDTFIARCRERLERNHAQEAKRTKVRNLKAQAIAARIRQIAREDGFDFCTEVNTRLLKLYVRLSEADCCELQIPFKDFEAMLPELRDAIRSIRSVYARGLRFGLRSAKSWRRRDWVRHDE